MNDNKISAVQGGVKMPATVHIIAAIRAAEERARLSNTVLQYCRAFLMFNDKSINKTSLNEGMFIPPTYGYVVMVTPKAS